jgi:hypothetical protein
LNKQFKMHAAFKCRFRQIKQSCFVLWRNSLQPVETSHDILSSHIRIESFNKFQGLQQTAADREAQLLEKMRELRELCSSSTQRERQLQNDLAQALDISHQEEQRADKLEKQLTLLLI